MTQPPTRPGGENAAYLELLNGWHQREFGGGDPDPVPFELIAMLTRVGERLCEYGGGEWIDRRCDCKFLAHDERWSEESGCAEIRTAIRAIERLSGTTEAHSIRSLSARVRKAREISARAASDIADLSRPRIQWTPHPSTPQPEREGGGEMTPHPPQDNPTEEAR